MLLTRRPAELLKKNVLCPSQGWRSLGILLRAIDHFRPSAAMRRTYRRHPPPPATVSQNVSNPAAAV
ncbi:MAG: hypothetical protein ACKO38_02910 [Planctomycetota bacterium]